MPRGLAPGARYVEIMIRNILLALVRGYQKYISPAFPACCRFTPTCSQYAMEAIDQYGAIKGGWLALKRIMRCNPFCRGGYDPVPQGKINSMTTTNQEDSIGDR